MTNVSGLDRIRAGVRSAMAVIVSMCLVTGLPWLLWRTNGLPWPDQAMSASDVIDRLAQPITDPLLVQLLALIGWACWAGFCLSLLREAAWYARHLPHLRRDRAIHTAHIAELSPHRALAALCIGALVLTLFAAWRSPTALAQTPSRTAPSITLMATTAEKAKSDRVPVTGLQDRECHVVLPGDSLWDIARVHLGDPLRWPVIYALNKGREQVDGGQLTDPDLLRAGWRLHLPPRVIEEPVVAPDSPHHTQKPTHPASPKAPFTSKPDPGDSRPSQQYRPEHAERGHSHQVRTGHHDRPAAISVGQAGLIGITTAAGIAAALAFARAHQRRRHRPNLNTQGPPPLAQTVRTATRAHAAAIAHQPTATSQDASAPRRSTPQRPRIKGTVTIGTVQAQEITLDELSHRGGCCLTGPGTWGTARALLIGVLTAAERTRPDPPPVRAVMPRSLAHQLLAHPPYDLPALEITDDTTETLAVAERHLLAHARTQHDQDATSLGPGADGQSGPGGMLVLVPSEASHAHQLTALASRCAPGVMTLIILGELPDAPDTPHLSVDAEGHITSTGLAANELDQLELFRLDEDAAGEVIDLIRAAHGEDNLVQRPRVDLQHPRPPHHASEPLSSDSNEHDDTPEGEPFPPIAEPSSVVKDNPEIPAQESIRPVHLQVLGPFVIRIKGRRDPVGLGLREEAREFLALLAAHPSGMRSEEIIEHLRLAGGMDEAARDLANIRRAVRRVLRAASGHNRAAFVVIHGDRHHIDPHVISTDLAQFTSALHKALAADSETLRISHLQRAIDVYGGPFTDGADYPWSEEVREGLHRKAVDALTRVADHFANSDVDRALELLDQAASFNPTNEAIYQRIIRLQRDAGRDDAARRTYELLTHRLATIEVQPTPATRALLQPRSGLTSASTR